MKLNDVVAQLRDEERRLQSELERVSGALKALDSVKVSTNGRRGRKPRRTMSAAARARIGAAKRAWWAKLKRK